MSKPIPEDEWRCRQKRKYGSEKSALSAVARIQRPSKRPKSKRDRSDPEKPELYVYPCGHCGCWHLTRRRQRW